MLYGWLVSYTENVGDDVQSVAALQFYPRVDVVIHREYLGRVRVDDEVKVVLNGWFMYRPWNWPPPRNVLPLLVSIHLDPYAAWWMLRGDGLAYFKRHEPVGARDLYTLRVLRRRGVSAYFSSCLTLTLDYKFGSLKAVKEGNYIVLVDVPDVVSQLIRKKFGDSVVVLSNELNVLTTFDRFVLRGLGAVDRRVVSRVFEGMSLARLYGSFFIVRGGGRVNLLKRLRKVFMLLSLLANACCVITTRLHVALPSLAFQVPTALLVHDYNDPRFSGNSYLLSTYTLSELLERLKAVRSLEEVARIGSVDTEILQKIKSRLIYVLSKFMN